MSLFQCQHCGCVENSAISKGGFLTVFHSNFDWTGMEDRCGLQLCSACIPPKYKSGKSTNVGWHDQFNRMYLPHNEWFTNKRGDLEHILTGNTDFHLFWSSEPFER